MKWIIPFVLILGGCSSTPTVNGVRYEKDQILSTCNDSSQPSWADETKSLWFEGSKVYSLGITTISGGDRPEAGVRIAQNSARANIAQSVSDRLEFIFQNAEEGTGVGETSKYIGSEVSDLTSHSMMPESNWWKRYVQYGEDGPHIYYKIYSLITMPQADFKKAIYEAINGISDHKLSETFQTQVNHQWDRFVDGKQEKQNDIAATNPQNVLSQVADKKDTKDSE